MGREIVFLFSFYVVAFIHALLDFFTQFAKGARFLSESPVMLVLVLEKEKWFLLES